MGRKYFCLKNKFRTQFLYQKIFLQPLLSYFAEFSATWQPLPTFVFKFSTDCHTTKSIWQLHYSRRERKRRAIRHENPNPAQASVRCCKIVQTILFCHRGKKNLFFYNLSLCDAHLAPQDAQSLFDVFRGWEADDEQAQSTKNFYSFSKSVARVFCRVGHE